MNSSLSRICLMALAALAAGCGPGSVPLDAPVSVSGKVIDAGGKPVGNVTLNLQPLENGYEKKIEVKPDGTFSLETQSGKYAYYFTPKSGTKAVPAPATKFVEASMERTVQIASGQAVEISLQ